MLIFPTDAHGLLYFVDAGYGPHDDLHIDIVAEAASDRRGYVGGRKAGGGYLIKQRLKKMVVLPVDGRK